MALALLLALASITLLPGLLASPRPLQVSGLSAPVTIVYDQWDAPHVWAANERDVFVAQGYITSL